MQISSLCPSGPAWAVETLRFPIRARPWVLAPAWGPGLQVVPGAPLPPRGLQWCRLSLPRRGALQELNSPTGVSFPREQMYQLGDGTKPAFISQELNSPTGVSFPSEQMYHLDDGTHEG